MSLSEKFDSEITIAHQDQPHVFPMKNLPLQPLRPRLPTVFIVLVQRDDRILLARSPRFPPGMFGLVAGFVEPCEDLEHDLVREILEETVITVKNIRYFGSEPWPFQNSLMVGFTADFAGGELVVDTNEIESAFWFNRKHLPRIL